MPKDLTEDEFDQIYEATDGTDLRSNQEREFRRLLLERLTSIANALESIADKE